MLALVRRRPAAGLCVASVWVIIPCVGRRKTRDAAPHSDQGKPAMTALKPQTRKWTRGILPHGGLEYYRQNPPQPAERPKGVHYTELAVHRRILNHLDNFSHAAPGFLLARRPSRGYDPFCRPDRNRPPAAGSLSPDPRTSPCPAALRGCRSSASPPSSALRGAIRRRAARSLVLPPRPAHAGPRRAGCGLGAHAHRRLHPRQAGGGRPEARPARRQDARCCAASIST